MIRVSLEADTAAELKAAVQELAGIGTAPSWSGVPVTAGMVPWPAELLPQTMPRRCLDIRYATEHPDHLLVELRVGNMRADGCFAVCWHKALPHVRKLVQSTNIFFRCKRMRLVERKDPRWENAKPKTRTKRTTSSPTKRRGASAK
jgi:hypothetical protein